MDMDEKSGRASRKRRASRARQQQEPDAASPPRQKRRVHTDASFLPVELWEMVLNALGPSLAREDGPHNAGGDTEAGWTQALDPERVHAVLAFRASCSQHRGLVDGWRGWRRLLLALAPYVAPVLDVVRPPLTAFFAAAGFAHPRVAPPIADGPADPAFARPSPSPATIDPPNWDEPKCRCGLRARLRAIEAGPTAGQRFYECARPAGHRARCAFFAWRVPPAYPCTFFAPCDGDPHRAELVSSETGGAMPVAVRRAGDPPAGTASEGLPGDPAIVLLGRDGEPIGTDGIRRSAGARWWRTRLFDFGPFCGTGSCESPDLVLAVDHGGDELRQRRHRRFRTAWLGRPRPGPVLVVQLPPFLPRPLAHILVERLPLLGGVSVRRPLVVVYLRGTRPLCAYEFMSLDGLDRQMYDDSEQLVRMRLGVVVAVDVLPIASPNW